MLIVCRNHWRRQIATQRQGLRQTAWSDWKRAHSYSLQPSEDCTLLWTPAWCLRANDPQEPVLWSYTSRSEYSARCNWVIQPLVFLSSHSLAWKSGQSAWNASEFGFESPKITVFSVQTDESPTLDKSPLWLRDEYSCCRKALKLAYQCQNWPQEPFCWHINRRRRQSYLNK